VPFTSESKEAVAHYPEILKEMQLALQECGRRLGSFLRRREAERHEQRRRSIFEMYIGELVESLGKLTPVDRARLQQDLMAMARKHTGDEDAADVLAAVGPTRKVAKRTAEWTDAERESAGVGTEAEERSRGRKTGPGKPRGRGKKAGAATAAAAGTSPARRPRRSPQLELLDPDEEEAS
jgi:DNA topoisomerase-6 subunit B